MAQFYKHLTNYILLSEPIPLESDKKENNWDSLSFYSKTNSKWFFDF